MSGDRRLLVRAHVPGASLHVPRLEVELEFEPGITAIMGPSGAGKTTLLSTIAGLLTPAAGLIVLGGVPLFDGAHNLKTHQRRVALVFQSLALFPHFRCWQNVAYGIAPLPRSERKQRALSWLARTRADHLAERFPSSLSGGEAQRVALARAFASEPRALLLDEPFSSLDAPLRHQLGSELRTLIAEFDIPALLVTHDRQDAVRLASRVVELTAGHVAPAAAQTASDPDR